jgi:hypothetical protein
VAAREAVNRAEGAERRLPLRIWLCGAVSEGRKEQEKRGKGKRSQEREGGRKEGAGKEEGRKTGGGYKRWGKEGSQETESPARKNREYSGRSAWLTEYTLKDPV